MGREGITPTRLHTRRHHWQGPHRTCRRHCRSRHRRRHRQQRQHQLAAVQTGYQALQGQQHWWHWQTGFLGRRRRRLPLTTMTMTTMTMTITRGRAQLLPRKLLLAHPLNRQRHTVDTQPLPLPLLLLLAATQQPQSTGARALVTTP